MNVLETYFGGGQKAPAELQEEMKAAKPEKYALHSNTPNPFNPETTIRFDLPEATHVELLVYNLRGQVVARLKDESMEAGFHSVPFNAQELPSGLYFYRLKAEAFSQVRRMMLLK